MPSRIPGHKALAYLEKIGIVKTVITQNVDNLHQKAGNRNVIEFHGNMLFARCMKCGKNMAMSMCSRSWKRAVHAEMQVQRGLKPDAVFFGEAIPQDALKRSFREADDCDLMLVIGTSAQVEPAASLPRIAKG